MALHGKAAQWIRKVELAEAVVRAHISFTRINGSAPARVRPTRPHFKLRPGVELGKFAESAHPHLPPRMAALRWGRSGGGPNVSMQVL